MKTKVVNIRICFTNTKTNVVLDFEPNVDMKMVISESK
jgi:hypothetical protein